MSITSHCTVCGKSKVCFKNRKSGQLVCRSCNDLIRYHNITKWENCFVCSKLRHVSIRDEGHPVCPNCYRIYYKQHEECSECGKVRALTILSSLGIALCNTCRSKYRLKDKTKYEYCFLCSHLKAVATRNKKWESVCYNCYPKYVATRE